jgi:hypothetical protein
LTPKYPATKTAPTAASLAAINSPFSEISGFILFLIRSCATDVEITSSKPAAVESAAASPPAATNAITQSGNPAISGFAKTIISLSIYSSFELLDGAL